MDPLFFEQVLIKFLFQDENVRNKISPFLKVDIFDDFENKEIIKKILSFENKFNKFPTISDMKLHITEKSVFTRLLEILELDVTEFLSDSLLMEIEDFFKKKLIWNEISEAADKLKEDKPEQISSIPDKLRTAVSFSFETNIGLNLFDDGDRMFNFIHNRDRGISTGIKSLDNWIQGGVHKKTITVFLGETNLGKTILKCALAANMLLMNKNVLYITLEMSEENIGSRILQNMFDLEQKELMRLNKEDFYKKYNTFKEKIKNNLIIKEYPTKSANTNTYRNLMKELEMKNKFIPDIVFIDYLGIMLPIYRLKSDNTYTEGKRIAEEVRGLAVEMNVPIITSVQSNRKGFNSSELSLDDIADSIGTAQGADIVIGAMQPADFAEQNKILLIILKNRYGMNKIKIALGINKAKSKIYDIEELNAMAESNDISNKTVEAISEIKSTIKKEKENNKNKIIDFD